jgi:hypothetical protein
MRLFKGYFISKILGATDLGEQDGREAYNPYTGEGHDPEVEDVNYVGYIVDLYLRDEMRPVRAETVPTIPDIVHADHDEGINLVLELDFKGHAAVSPAY